MANKGFWTNEAIASLKDITNNQRVLLANIDCLSYQRGYCWATNKVLLEQVHVSLDTLHSDLVKLEKKGYLIRTTERKDGMDSRHLQVAQQLRTTSGGDAEIPTPHRETSYTTHEETSYAPHRKTPHADITDELTEMERGPARPTLEEVRDYFNANNMSSDPEQFFDYYAANGWVQGKDKPIKDWKATARNWERREETYRPAQVSQEPPPAISEGFRLHTDADGKQHIVREETA